MSEHILRNLVEGFDESMIQRSPIDEHWQEIYAASQNQTILQAKVIRIDKEADQHVGIVYIGEVKGMIPLKLSGCKTADELRRLLGIRVAFKVFNYDRKNNLFTGSRLAALEQMEAMTWERLELGASLYSVVKEVAPNRVKVDIGGVVVTIKNDEISYAWIDDLRDKYKANDHILVKVIGLDKENKTVKVSHKATLNNPYPDCLKRYSNGQSCFGTITGVVEYGNFVNLEPGVDILCPHIRLNKVRLGKGDEVEVKITNIDNKKQKMFGRIVRKI